MLVVLATVWGAGFSMAKIGGQAGIPPIGYTFWQAMGSGVVLLVIAGARGVLVPANRSLLTYYVVAGLTAFALPAINAFVAVSHIPVGVMAILSTLSPILTYALSIPFGLDRAMTRRMIGIGFGFAGALLLIVPRASLPTPDMAPWVALGILTPIFYATSNIYVAKARPVGVDSLALAAGMQLAAAACLAILALGTGQFYVPWPPFGPGDGALVAHALIQALGFFLLFEVMRLAGPVFLSQVGFLSPISGIFWGMAFFGERHSTWIYAAMTVILVGLLMVSAPARPRPLSGSRG